MDVVSSFDRVKQSYIDYVKTAFGTQYPGLEAERERLLNQPGVICQEPWIEPIPRYKSAGKRLEDLTASDLPSLDSTEITDFKKLATCGLIEDYKLYEHQTKMLQKALSGENAVVTAGTGSGKTEAFLLPLFAYLVKESASWNTPDSRQERQDDWWNNPTWQSRRKAERKSPRVPQRINETRDAAVRSMIIYPMNALVEDQLTRIRRALDSRDARAWFEQNRGGNRFYFGRYNGQTPVPGHEFNPPTTRGNQPPDSDRIDRLTRNLKETEEAASKATQSQGDEAVRYFFPRLDGAEMRSRWDMQDSPPDILITNFSMLSMMLMRDADSEIFDKTRQWLEKDGSVFHLIIDELHLHRGTTGTEIAYLLKLLLHRLGITPDSPKLRILGSSASLDPDKEDSRDFLSQFFGSAWHSSQIIPGHPADDIFVSDFSGDPLPVEPFIAIAKKSAEEDPGTENLKAHAARLLREASPSQTGPSGDLEEILESEWQANARMLAACKEEDDDTRATSLFTFGQRLFGSDWDENDIREAVRGMLVARELCGESGRLSSFRMHWFFKNIEGLWACTQPGCGCDPAAMEGGRTAGKLFTNARILCDNTDAPHRVLDLLYCEVCGTTMFGGSRYTLPHGQGWELLLTDAEIEGLPDRQPARFVDRRAYSEFAIFWPSGDKDLNPDAKNLRQPTSKPNEKVQARWIAASFNPATGKVNLGNTEPVRGYAFDVPNPPDNVSALPAKCPQCAVDYQYRKYRKSPVRGFRTGFGRITQVLSKEMFHFLPDAAKKLIVFSDSRQDAAELANGIERSHYSDLVREAMYDELRKAAVLTPKLVAELKEHGHLVSPDTQKLAETDPGLLKEYSDSIEKASADASLLPPAFQ